MSIITADHLSGQPLVQRGMTKANFLSTSRRRPCPVCAKTNGNCRTLASSDLVLCMTLREDRHHPNYRYVGESRDNTWSTYVPRTNEDFDRDAWERRKTKREQRNREIERQRLEKCLSPKQRDAEIRSVLAQLSLTDDDRRYLEDRNVPAEVIARCRSVKQWHKLASPVHVHLPGVSKYGDRLNNPTDGILIAIPSIDGHLVAIRLHDRHYKNKENGRKYSAISSANRGIKPNLEDGGSPFGIFFPENWTDFTHIGLAEGPEFKAPAGSNKLNFPVVGFEGAAGIGNLEQYPHRLKEIEDYVKEELCLRIEKESLKLVALWRHTISTFATILIGQHIKDIATEYLPSTPCCAQFALMMLGISLSPVTSGLEIGTISTENRSLSTVGSMPSSFGINPHTPTDALGTSSPCQLKTSSYEFTFTLIPDAGMLENKPVMSFYGKALETLNNNGYNSAVAWWGQFTKADGDIDEIPDDRPIDFISPAQFLSYCPEQPKTTVEKFTDWVKKQTRRIKPKGFGAVKLEGEKFTGSRDDAWQQAIERGQTLLDNTLMGSGKSHSVPEITNPYGGKIWYAYSDHRNPTVAAIAHEFVDLYPRNSQGFYRDSGGKIRPADAENPATITRGHCERADLFPMLTELGHDPHDGGGDNPICQTCPMANLCAHTSGWYRYDRRETLESAQRIRCHIESMPRDWDYSKDIVIVDEPSQLLTPTKTISTTWGELLKEADRIRPDLSPEQWTELDAFLQALKPLFGNTPRYGLTHGEITAQLPTPSPELVEAIAANPLNLADLFPTVELENLTDHFTPTERKKWGAGLKAYNTSQRQEQYTQTQANLANLHPNVLIHLVNGQATRRLTGNTLTLTLDRREDYSFLKRTAARIFLDATINGDRLQTLTGIEGEIKVINNTPERPLANQTVHHIKVQGIGSKSLSSTAVNRLAAICRTLGDMPTIGLKAWAKYLDIDGYWWRNSRGTNDYAGIDQLLALGLPHPNVGAIEDQYLCLKGNLDGFEEHYARLVNEEILQLVGRQRANRYPDRHFVLNLVTPEHTDLSWLANYGITVIVKTGFEITPAAGNENQFTRWQILQAILDGHRTQTAIAQTLGMTQQAISKSLKATGVTLQTLTERLTKLLPEMTTTGPYKSYTRTSCITEQLYKDFAWFLELDMVAIAQEVVSVINREGWLGFLKYLENYPKPAQGKFLGVVYTILATESPPLRE